LQNFDPALTLAPQFGHVLAAGGAREAPQFLQNCAPVLTGALQLGHTLAGGVVNVAGEVAGGC